MKCTNEEMVVLATILAMCLAKNLKDGEICNLQAFLGQMSCSLSALLALRKN